MSDPRDDQYENKDVAEHVELSKRLDSLAVPQAEIVPTVMDTQPETSEPAPDPADYDG